MCVAASGAPRFFPLAVVPRGGSLPALSAWARELQRLARQADHPWSQPLAVASLLQQARQALAP
jgi:DNA polymerase III subunit delta'